jgi:hypothetical protein
MTRLRSLLRAGLLSAACFGLIFAFCVAIVAPATPSAIPPVRTAKCTIDIAAGKQTNCTLVKANHEWILWSNSGATPRSIHFTTEANPFSESSCTDVGPDARARSGPIALNAAPKTYVAYTSDVACDSNPPSNPDQGALKVIVQ